MSFGTPYFRPDFTTIAHAADDALAILQGISPDAEGHRQLLWHQLDDRIINAGHWPVTVPYAINRLKTLGKVTVLTLPVGSPLAEPNVELGDRLIRLSETKAKEIQATAKQTGADLIDFDDVRKLLGIGDGRLHNVTSEWRSAGTLVHWPASYAVIRPLIVAKWPKKAALFPESVADFRRILDGRK